ncbi:hypothetical protein CBG25_05550 [Arsenophonus sp. ENCA]|uniref:hypothetical protein n=1 Tax=Arsenophonus sp. ENCA TaxID=1987579 RepID=UPI000BD7D929|nr:hypothetical protein [Arsenophonus sp. ENCA]PAV06568.1 hypothetical protein CBG25_05550 [Arsenophonus sp. ENCA]
MTDKDKNKNQDDNFIVHQNEIIDNDNEDVKALDRNLIHSANKRGLNKKVKAFLALVSFAVVAILMLIIGGHLEKPKPSLILLIKLSEAGLLS